MSFYGRVYRQKGVSDDETNPLVSILWLSGITRVERGYLRTRNRIYGNVFDQAWIKANMPDAEVRRQRAAFRRGLMRATGVAAVTVAMMAVPVLSGSVSFNGTVLLSTGESVGCCLRRI